MKDYLAECSTAIPDADLGGLEVVIVDDGSVDSTGCTAAEYADEEAGCGS